MKNLSTVNNSRFNSGQNRRNSAGFAGLVGRDYDGPGAVGQNTIAWGFIVKLARLHETVDIVIE